MKHQARSIVIWSGLDILLGQGVGLLITIVLARLLSPEDFGVIALLAFFINLSGIFIDAGFANSLIQRQDVTHTDESTVFWFNIAMAVLMMVSLMLASSWIADFFAVPVLQTLTFALAVNLLINALGTIHGTLMIKRLDFKTPMIIGTVSSLISGCIGIYMAGSGWGVWALVGQTITGSLLGLILKWSLFVWRPAWVFSWNSLRRLFGFGGYLSASWIVNAFYDHSFAFLLGKFYAVSDVGIYNRAYNTQQLPSNLLTGLISRAAFPLMSAMKGDSEQLKKAVRLANRNMMVVLSPVMFGLVVVAEPFMVSVFGDQWRPAVPVMQVLCLVGLLHPIQVTNLTALQAQGHARLFFNIGVFKNIIGLGLVVGGIFFGIMGVAMARTLNALIAYLINCYYMKKFIGYGASKQLLDLLPTLFASFGMILPVLLLKQNMSLNGINGLVAMVLTGAVVYFGINVIFRVSAFTEALKFFRKRSDDV